MIKTKDPKKRTGTIFPPQKRMNSVGFVQSDDMRTQWKHVQWKIIVLTKRTTENRKNTVHAVRLPCSNHARRRVRNVDCIYIGFVLIGIITQKARETVCTYCTTEVLRKPFDFNKHEQKPAQHICTTKACKRAQYALSMPRSEIHSTSIQCPACLQSLKFLRFQLWETSVHRRLLLNIYIILSQE